MRLLVVGRLGLLAIGGCGGGLDAIGGDAESGAQGSAATLLGEIDTNLFCDMVGLVDVLLEATPVGCAPDDDGCDLPEPPVTRAGTVFTCPATDPRALLGVEVELAATYRVEARGRFTTGESVARCFRRKDETGGGFEVGVSSAEVAESAQIQLQTPAEPCPEG